ncbi:MAG TPA: alpha/beta hydrolase [Pyrinomonadaceae bacterium]|nr:alpha/beta hydrolase [Pyrinomonadaceae bacterium]
MATTTRLFKSFSKLLFPVILLVVAAIVAGSVWMVYTTAHPLNSRYLVTPDKYGQLSSRAAQVTEETWTNKDGSTSRGWLLRGTENAPAVILLHKFGADRSFVLNLGVKLNESTNFTVLMPDQRAHGENPGVKNASFGGCEAEDATSSIEFLRNLKTQNQIPFVGKNIGIFGVEMGAMVAVSVAVKDPGVKAIALDSVPQDSDGVLKESVQKRFPFVSSVTTRLAGLGTYLYFFDGCYKREPICDTARRIENRNVLLLAGVDAPEFQESTSKLSKCFPATNRVESKLDLSPSGFSIINASMEQSEAYDQRIIDFFRNALNN